MNDNRFYKNHSTLVGRLADQAHQKSLETYQERTKTEKADQVIFYDIFNQNFAELIVEHCAKICMSQADRLNIRKAFGVPVESSVKYKGPEPRNSIESQYNRELNTTRIE